MSSELDKIKVRVFNLLNRTTDRGCTEAEAIEAMNLAGKLMDQYDLTISDVQIKNSSCVKRVIMDGSKKSRGPIDSCVVNLAYYCDVKVWKNSGLGYTVFGLPQDTEMFEYFFDMIKNSMESCLQEYLASQGMSDKQEYGIKRKVRSSFCRGFARRISSRLKEMKKERIVEVERTGRSLVLVKMAKVNEDFAGLKMKLTKSYSQHRISYPNANNAGYSAGGKVSLNPGVSSGGSIKRLK